MSGIIKPTYLQINWNNPITKGLVFDTPLFERGSGTPVDLVSKQKGAGTNTPTWITDLFGPALTFNGSASTGQLVTYTSVPAVQTLHQMSAEGYLYSKTSGGGTNGRFLHKKNGATYWKIQMGGTNTTMSFDIDCTTTFPDWSWTITQNVWFHFILTYDDSANGNVPVVYINGAPVAVTTNIAKTEARIADDANLYLGNYVTGTKTWDGYIAYGRVWNRILNAQEVRQLYADPFKLYKRPSLSLASYLSTIEWMQARSQPSNHFIPDVITV